MGELIITTLATYGLSSLLTSYDGPFDVFLKLRELFPRSPLECTVCTSVWVSIAFFLVLLLGLGYYLLPLAIVWLVILLERL